MKRSIHIFLFLSIISCVDPKSNQEKIDVYRFENYLFNSDSTNIIQRKSVWESELGVFTPYFDYYIMNRSSKDETLYCDEILAFINNAQMREVYDTICIKFRDFSYFEKQIQLSFGKWKEMLCMPPPKKIITLFSGFNYGVISQDSMLIIGLDFFLESKSKFYSYLQDPKYIRLQKNSRFLLSYILESWIDYNFNSYNTKSDFLAQMIYKGKIMYLINKLTPYSSQRDKFRFSEDEMIWCENNEFGIWAHFIENDLLFSTQQMEFLSYLNPSPFGKGMPRESPGRISYFTGHKIVSNYMHHNSGISIEELMRETDAQLILKKSKYKPKR
ncbi:MAG: hypothetical protein VX347_04170 [Bacteroidota bacterium]|nr:hypothetical protein [Bacteroidota bacterium]